MSNSTNESEDGLHCKDESGSSMLDEVNKTNAGGVSLKKGPWTSAEDVILVDYVKKHGEGNWNAVQKHSGLSRCGKSCRLRWANHLRPNLKKGAFTAEEEQLIIELHAKMGNKWARMATHLPGRTDNEIKNYWNTRTKRRQRGGLPLYPPELCLQGLQARQEGEETGGIDNGDEDYDPWPAMYELIPDAIFDRFTVNQELLPYAPELLKMSPDNLLYKGYVSSQYCSFMTPAIHRKKCVQESTSIFPNSDDCVKSSVDHFVGYTCDKIAESLGSYFSYDPDIARKSTMSPGVIQGDHSFSNGNSSVSKPLTGEEKSELPSLQFAETDFGIWDTAPLPLISGSVDAFIQFPSSNSVIGSDCSSQGNSGLLDALLHEDDSVCIVKDHSTGNNLGPGNVLPSANFNVYETQWKDYIEPPTPFGHSGHPRFTECTPISSSGSSFEEFPPDVAFTGSILNTEPLEQAWWLEKENEVQAGLNFAHPGASLVSDWLEQNSESVDDRSNMSGAVAMLDGDDMDADYAAMAAGTSTTCTSGLEMSCCAWNNGPAVPWMSDPPQ